MALSQGVCDQAGGGGGGGRRLWRSSRRDGPHVLRLPQDVASQRLQEDGHLVVHVVVLFHQPRALTTSTLQIHLEEYRERHCETLSTL